MGSRLRTTLAALAALAAVAGSPLFADEEAETGPDVVALIVALDPDAQAFSSVVAGAFGLRFSPTGLLVDVRTVTATGSGQPDDDALVRQAGAGSAGAVLICRYAVVNQKMTATMNWRDLPNGGRATVSETGGRLDLSLGDFVLKVLDTLLAAVHDRIIRMSATRRAAAATGAAGLAGPASAMTLPSGQKDDTSVRRFSLSIVLAPFVPVGDASSWLDPGSTSSVEGAMVFPVPSGFLGVGLSLGAVFFSGRSAPEGTTTLFLPLGLNATYRLGPGAGAGLVFQLTGGAAVILVSSSTLGTRAKTVPFVRGAAGVELLFSRSVGIRLDAGYALYFETPVPIMAVSPSLGISLGL